MAYEYDDFDVEKLCTVCGNPGAAPDGLCIACSVAKTKLSILLKHEWDIGFVVLMSVMRDMQGLFIEALPEINAALVEASEDEPKPISIGFTVKFEPTMNGVETTSRLAFSKRYKIEKKNVASERQRPLDLQPKGGTC